jgi:hypothetical protein
MRPFSSRTADKLLRWYINQPEGERYECHQEQRQRIVFLQNEARKVGNKVELDGKLQYQAFLYGIDKRFRLHCNRRLKTTDDLEVVASARIAVVKAESKAKASPKQDRLHGDLRPVVERLRGEGMSWQKVSDYLARFHKVRISRGFLQKVFADR